MTSELADPDGCLSPKSQLEPVRISKLLKASYLLLRIWMMRSVDRLRNFRHCIRVEPAWTAAFNSASIIPVTYIISLKESIHACG